jgi:hypothetical protein
MAKKRGATAAKSRASATTTNKKKQSSKVANVKDVLLVSLLQDCSKKPPQMSVETLVPGHVFVSRNFMSHDECRGFIDIAESSGDMDYVSHPATREIAQRECGRWQRNDVDVARKLFERMTTILQEMQLDCFPTNYIPVACNSNLRLYKYEKNMSFGKHYDGSHPTDEGMTEITVLVYLSNCVGGATRFYPTQTKRKNIAFTPEEGAILLHIHGDRCLQHEADAVVSGVKYVLRTDVVYAKKS